MEKIKCTKCKEERNLEDFHINLITNKIKRPCVHCCRNRYKKEYSKIDLIENEIWKNVVGYEEFYEISNFGRLKTKQRSLINVRNIEHRTQEFLMSPCINKKGYFQCSLSNGKVKKSFLVHRLVALAFISPLKEKPFINHIDGNPLNNLVSNLEWCTQKENVIHGFETGLTKSLFGENHKLAVLNEYKVLAIRRLHKINPKFNRSEVAKKLKVKNECIGKIILRRTWKHI